MSGVNERVDFRLLHMECCGHLLCWVNPRLPSFCPTCSKPVYPDVKGWAVVHDNAAHLRYRTNQGELR